MRFAPMIRVLPAVLLAACVSSSDIQQLNDRITDLQDQITELKRQASNKSEVEQLNAKLGEQTQTLLRSSADVTARVGQIDDKLQNTQGMIEQTNYRLDRLAQQVTENQNSIQQLQAAARGAGGANPAPGGPGNPVTQTVTVPGGGPDPVETYQTAYRDYQKGNYDLAIEGFRDFARNNPKSDLADNASYWIGESLFSQKKYREAIEQFDMVINTFPQSDKVPAALLKKGYAYVELGQKAQGVVQLQYVIHEHPRSREAALAQEKLKALGISTN